MTRVAITGAGALTPLGLGVADTTAAMLAGRTAIRPYDGAGSQPPPVRLAAQVPDFAPAARLTARELALGDRVSQLALLAAREAVAQAFGDGALPDGAGAIIGTAGGGAGSADDAYRALYERGERRVHPFTLPRTMMNAPASTLSIAFGLTGPVMAVATACASSNHALGLAFQLVRAGAAPAMLAGGSDAMLTYGGLRAWEGLRVISDDGCRPFSGDRAGFVPGEGAAVFVLEPLEAARRRGAPVLAEVAGFGMGADAVDLVQPDPAGAARAMRAALQDAGLAPGDIGYVNAHGSATRANDRSEAAAIRATFPAGVAVSSTKGAHGHLMGASGAVELLACLAALAGMGLAPNTGWRTPDAECDLDLVLGAARAATPGAVLSNAFAFGGLNAVLALRATG